MNNKIVPFTMVFFLFTLILCQDVFSWDNVKTHRDLSEYAAESSVLSKNKGDYLKNLGFNNALDEYFLWGQVKYNVRDWLREGSFLEDEGSSLDAVTGTARYSNHFHNPLKLWGESGLSDLQSGESTVLWAQNSTKQENSLGGDWSWQKIRLCYYTALIVQSEADKQTFFACTFEGLGYQMHLIEDMSVPSHTRNDAHPLDSLVGTNYETGDYYFETWAKKNYTTINYYASSPLFPQVALNVNYNGRLPIAQFIDSEQYKGTMPSTSLTWGLSEYTNSNFASDDTIFTEDREVNDKHYFPYPRYSTDSYEMYEVENSWLKKRIYLKKKGDGEQIEHFTTAGPLFKWLSFDPALQKSELKLDPTVFNDYASKLIPRAVGYSAGLLDYFFRGSIDISLPGTGVYAKADNSGPGFTSIKLKATNITTTGENMTEGTIQLVVKYKLAETDPFQSEPVTISDNFYYTVVPEKNNVNALYIATPTELNFDLSQNYIPLWATDLSLQLVYHGKLANEDGTVNEDGAVAVGFKDISEPTPIDIYNNMDKICMNGGWHDAGSESAKQQAPDWDVYPHKMENISIKTSSIANPQNASPTNFDHQVPLLAAGNMIRSMYILGDYQDNPEDYRFNISIDKETIPLDPKDSWSHSDVPDIYKANTIKNQTDYNVQTQEECDKVGATKPCDIRYYPLFYSFRGSDIWGPAGVIFENPKYPETTDCSWSDL